MVIINFQQWQKVAGYLEFAFAKQRSWSEGVKVHAVKTLFVHTNFLAQAIAEKE